MSFVDTGITRYIHAGKCISYLSTVPYCVWADTNERNKVYHDGEWGVPVHDETVLLIDAWESQEAIDVHHASPMMKTIAELREKYDLHMKVERYLSNDGGVPVPDEEFIRR